MRPGEYLPRRNSKLGDSISEKLTEYLVTMFEQYPGSIRQDVPKEFALNHLVGSLADDVRWWIGNKMEMPPEELADCYLKMIGYGF